MLSTFCHRANRRSRNFRLERRWIVNPAAAFRTSTGWLLLTQAPAPTEETETTACILRRCSSTIRPRGSDRRSGGSGSSSLSASDSMTARSTKDFQQVVCLDRFGGGRDREDIVTRSDHGRSLATRGLWVWL